MHCEIEILNKNLKINSAMPFRPSLTAAAEKLQVTNHWNAT